MKLVRLLTLASRSLFVLFCLATSVYCLMAYLPFTYQQVVRGKLLPGLDLFAEWHPKILALFTLLLVVDLFALLKPAVSRRSKSAIIGVGLVALQAGAAIFCSIHPVLSHLENSFSSFVLAVVALMPAILMLFAATGALPAPGALAV